MTVQKYFPKNIFQITNMMVSFVFSLLENSVMLHKYISLECRGHDSLLLS